MPTGLEGEAINLSSCIAVVVGTFINHRPAIKLEALVSLVN